MTDHSTPRLAPVAAADYTAEQAELVREYESTWRRAVRAPGDELGGPFDVTLRDPDFARAMMPLGDHFRTSPISLRRKELVVLTVAAATACTKVWGYHVDPARRAGWSEGDLADLRRSDAPAGADDDERCIHRVSQAIASTGRVDDETYDEALRRLGEVGLVEIAALTGYYRLVAELVNLSLRDDQALAPDEASSR